MCSKLSTVPNSKLSASIKRRGEGGSILGISMQMNGPGFQLHSGFPPPRAFPAPGHARLGGLGSWRRGGPEFEFQNSALWLCVLVPVSWPLKASRLNSFPNMYTGDGSTCLRK